MTDRLIRMMRIITLVQAKPGILARELAERCGNSERTIYRDMDALSAMHIPITHLGHGKGYAFIGNFALYPLDWSEEESNAFSQLLNIMKDIKPLLPMDFESAYEKVLATEYKHKAEREEKMESAKREAVTIWPERSNSQVEQPPFLTAILAALLKQKSIQVDYSENAYEEKGIKIDPYCLVPLENRYHLIGFCHRVGDIRTFHINDFSSVKPLNRWFSKQQFDLQAFMKQKWSLDRDSLQVEFKVRFSERMMDRIKDEEMDIKPNKVDRQARHIHFKVAIDQDIGFVRWVMRFEEEAEIIEPSYYREALRNQLEKWLMLYK
ncbi:WYL domain-containing protein [Paenibacillus sp. 19GGS1-52]|uniref:helix-turn-helix transcriptional regulator n=1 Tax=Paenibacillus sp. 19GGS1-52 TaxID=2758563 RepID=UPI001EFA927B|nr:WYL domain-containing protein [Paenibacillus sp. 19GGS1-52]ULO06674.1 WYL domain-containing protein [Paenibacillus sp. 19GGS1-52]